MVRLEHKIRKSTATLNDCEHSKTGIRTTGNKSLESMSIIDSKALTRTDGSKVEKVEFGKMSGVVSLAIVQMFDEVMARRHLLLTTKSHVKKDNGPALARLRYRFGHFLGFIDGKNLRCGLST